MHPAVRLAARGAAALAIVATLNAGLPAMAQEAPVGPAAVAAGEPILLRAEPGYDAVALATIQPGEPVEVVGAATYAADGGAWLPVAAGGQSGFLPAGAVGASAAPTAAQTDGASDAAAGEAGEGHAPPADAGVPSADLAVADPVTVDPAAGGPAGTPDSAATGMAVTALSDVNLRTGPSADDQVLAVLPPGAPVSVDGEPVNGFLPVTANGASGWIASDLVGAASTAAAPAPVAPDAVDPVATEAAADPMTTAAGSDPVVTQPDPAADAGAAPPLPEPVSSEDPASVAAAPAAAPRDRERGSTGIAWPFRGGSWVVIQGYNNGTHTNRSDFAQYAYSIDWARSEGERSTVGQPVYAPVSGSIQWTDPGSGGLLIDAGNGYGVALFHLTVDRGLRGGGTVERGQQIGVISGPGGEGYMSVAHIQTTVWKLSGGGQSAVPFDGGNALGGQQFPASGEPNQYMGVEVRP